MAGGVETQHADGVDFALEVIVPKDELSDQEAGMAITCSDADVASHLGCCSPSRLLLVSRSVRVVELLLLAGRQRDRS